MFSSNFNLHAFLAGLIVIILSIAIHEFGHAISADKLGDPGPRNAGRVTLWPDKHFDPFGFIMIIFTLLAGFGLGWGKPVLVNPRLFRNPRRDMVIVAACGPLMNFILATFAGLIMRFLLMSGQVDRIFDASLTDDSVGTGFTTLGLFLWKFMGINLALMFFNLIPIHPLDGSKILGGFLPENMARRYDETVGQWGPLLLLLLCFSGTGIIGKIISPAIGNMIRLLIGV